MRRSAVITLGLVPLAASWFVGCGRSEPPTHQQVCVDQQQRVLDDEACRAPRRAGGGFFPYWLYMPYRAGGYPMGAGVSAGSTLTRPQGADVRIAEGRVVRGVFGSSARSAAS